MARSKDGRPHNAKKKMQKYKLDRWKGEYKLDRWKRRTYGNDEPEMKRGLLGLEDVEDIGCVVGKLVQRHPHLLLCPLHRDVHARHLPGASHSPFAVEVGETEALGNWVRAGGVAEEPRGTSRARQLDEPVEEGERHL